MKYNIAKRTLSLLSAILGLFISILAVASGVLGIVGLIKNENSEFAIGSSINELGLKINFADSTVKWTFLVIIIFLAITNFIISISLINKPLEIDERFVSNGGKKVLFCLFTVIAGASIPLQIFSKRIETGDKTITYVAAGVIILTVLMQFFSMFFRSVQKEKVKKAKILKNKKVKNEIVVVKEKQATELVPTSKSDTAIFGSLANDPKLDSFEQRVREIKHLKEAGLINDEQAAAAVENIIDGFLN